MNEENLILFLIKYGGYESGEASDFVGTLPATAVSFAKSVYDKILKDSTITEEYKAGIIKSYSQISI